MNLDPIRTLSQHFTINDAKLVFSDMHQLDDDNFTTICRTMANANGTVKIPSSTVRNRFKMVYGAFSSVDNEPLSVRAVYYRIVSLYNQPKTEVFYKTIQGAIALLRDYGMLPFSQITDGSRELYKQTTYSTAGDFLQDIASTYKKDMWQDSEQRVLIVVEKTAMLSILNPICLKYGVGILPSRGFNSKTAWYELINMHQDNTTLNILLLTDHDTSGLQMAQGGLEAIVQHDKIGKVLIHRIGLTPAQILEMDLPTRDDKTDKNLRACELDSMTPNQARTLVENEILQYIDIAAFNHLELLEEEERKGLALLTFGD